MTLRSRNAGAILHHLGTDSPALTDAETLTDGSADENDYKDELFETQMRLTSATTTTADLTARVQDLKKQLVEQYNRATAAEGSFNTPAKPPAVYGISEILTLTSRLDAADAGTQIFKDDLEVSQATVAARDEKIVKMAEKYEDLHRKHFNMLENTKKMKADFEARYNGATFLQARVENLEYEREEIRENLQTSSANSRGESTCYDCKNTASAHHRENCCG